MQESVAFGNMICYNIIDEKAAAFSFLLLQKRKSRGFFFFAPAKKKGFKRLRKNLGGEEKWQKS